VLDRLKDHCYRQAVMNTCLKHWRRKNRLTLEDMSDLTGYSIAMLSRVERGERQLAPLSRVAVAKRLGVPIRDLFPVEPLDEGEA